ncbi:MAG: hypothetical protein KIC60_06125 [Clostridium sp.]|nr:hypothetical protein [Clostridium sp.]
MEYRYMIWNDVQKCFQFPSICETTEKGANTLLFKKIGNDARKYRFQIKKVEKEKAYKIRQELKIENKAKRIKKELENISFDDILALVKKNNNLRK